MMKAPTAVLVCYGSGGRAIHVEYLELEVVDFNNGVEGGAKGRCKQGSYDRQTYETDTYLKAGLKCVAKLDADAHAQDG